MSPHAVQARIISRWARAWAKYSFHSLSLSGTTSVRPRCWTGCGIRLSPEDESAARGGHGPAEVHGDFGVLDLAATAGRVVVGVLALGGTGAVVVHGAAELAHVLDDHRHAVRVTLAEMTARRVVRPLAAEFDDAARDVRDRKSVV